MSAGDSAAVAAWVAAGVSVLFGGTGFIVGLVGLHHARQAKEAAASANLIAKDANAISKQANSLSEESNDIAKDANEISRKTADRGDEQHDVDWEWTFAGPPHDELVTIQNIGKDKAHEVTIQFMFEAVTEANPTPMEIAGRESVQFTIPGLKEAIEAERREVARIEYERARSSPLIGASSFFHLPASKRTRLRVKWRRASGAPERYDSGWESSFLPD
jgi:hypothetical protein